jgi:hypothetical protein
MPKELGVLAVKLAYQRDATLAQSSAFADWSLQNVDAFKRG